jgi:uncharacterized protein (UPF0335 family)
MSVLMLMLAQAPPVDPQISGNWILGVLGAIGTILGIVYGHAKGKSSQRFTLDTPVPEVPFRKVPGMVSWNDHQQLITRIDRLEKHFDDLRKEQSEQFKDILEHGAVREQRIMDKIDAVAREWHSRMDTQFGPKPHTRRS